MIPPATLELRLFCGICYAILSLIGLFAHFLNFLAFLKQGHSLWKITFYSLAIQMLICDVTSLIVQLVIAVPLTIAADNVYSNISMLYKLMNTMDTVVFNTNMLLTFWMVVNRLTVFLFQRMNEVLFRKNNTHLLVLCTWLYCMADVLWREIFNCTKEFNTSGFYFHFNCDNPVGKVILKVNTYQTFVLPVAIFLIYLTLFFFLRLNCAYSGSKEIFANNVVIYKQKRTTEMNLLTQGAIISFFLELQTVSFSLGPKLDPTGYASYYFTFVQNVISILNNFVKPIIYIWFNRDMRSFVKKMIYGNTSTTTVFPQQQKMSQHGPKRVPVPVGVPQRVYHKHRVNIR